MELLKRELLYNVDSSPQLANCILWGNTATTAAPQMYNHISNSNPSITYSDIQDGCPAGATCSHLIDADPLFVDASNDNLRLRATLPAIDAGDNTAVPANVTTDLDGNPRTIGAAVDMGAYETLPAVVSITRAAADPTNAASIPFTVTFNVPALGVDATAFAATTTGGQGGATLGTISGSGTTWTVSVNTIDDATGTIRLDLEDTDTITATPGVPLGGTGAGNGDFSAGEVYTVDRMVPTVSMASTAPDPTNLSPIPVTVTFGEVVSGFTAGDVVAGNGTLDNFATVSDSVYTFDLTPSGQGQVTADVAADVAQDSAGNGNTAAAQFSITYDSAAPTVTIDQAAGQPDPTGIAPISFTVVFTEPVSGFDGDDVNLGASTAPGSLSAAVTEIAPLDGTTYHVAVGGMTGPGDVIASLLAGVAADLAGNPNAPSTSTDNSVTFDPVVPVVTGVRRAALDPTNAASLPFTVTFSKGVSGVDGTDFSLTTDGTLSGASVVGVSGSDATWTVTVDTGSGSGTLRLDVIDDDSIQDGAGNPLGGTGAGNGDFTAGEVHTIDRAGPSVVSLDAPDVAEFGAAVYTITVVYSDSLALDGSSLDDADLRVTGPGGFDQPATFVGVMPAGDGAPRTATYRITPPDGTWDDPDRGDYAIALEAGQVYDTLGNAAAGATLGTFEVGGPYQIFLPLVVREP